MNERKKPGPKPKAKPCAECSQVVGHYDDCPAGMGVARVEGADVPDNFVIGSFSGAKSGGRPITEPVQFYEAPFPDLRPTAQAYALRVWSGQSDHVPRHERVARVMAALEGQNLPTDGVELP